MWRDLLAPTNPYGRLRFLASGLGLGLTLVAFVLGLGAFGCEKSPLDEGPAGSHTAEVRPEMSAIGDGLDVEVIAENLDVPWSLAFAPDDRLFFTERSGRIRVIENGVLAETPVATIDVAAVSEAGLLGLALDPDFSRNHYIYVYYTYRADGFSLRNRVVRLVERAGKASQSTVILDDIPGGVLHDGGRIRFGPDRKLYITTGEVTNQALAQDSRSLAGKILRINPDGSIPDDNPFADSPIYSLGHRNPQGLAWHPATEQLYSTEHGPVGNDEVNIIEKGKNYGWPVIQGAAAREGFETPIFVFAITVAPSGADFFSLAGSPWDGSLFVATLRGEQLTRIILESPHYRRVKAAETLLNDEYGRLRDVIQGPDGWLYVATNNRDGRGRAASNDDRIVKIRPRSSD